MLRKLLALFDPETPKNRRSKRLRIESLESRHMLTATGPTVDLVVDDGDVNYSEVGSWTDDLGSGYQADQRISSGASGDQATWTFDNLAAGQRFHVLATWDADVAFDPFAEFTVYDGQQQEITRLADQQAFPGDVTLDGTGWLDLGEVVVDSGGLQVQLSGSGSGFLAADAVRIVDDFYSPVIEKVQVRGQSWSPAFLQALADNNLGNGGYDIPVGSGSNQLATVPWGNVDQISITFSESVDVDQDDLIVAGVNVPLYTVSDFSYDDASQTATWTLSQPFAVDKVLLKLRADGNDPVQDAFGNVLDGEWDNPDSPSDPTSDTYPSGDGQAGGNLLFRFNTLRGDVDGSYATNVNDVAYTYSLIGSQATVDPRADLNTDGYINFSDFLLVRSWTTAELPSGEPDLADQPNLTVCPAFGEAGTAIPLNISASLVDTDGSETLSITIAGVPSESSLSAGTDNGDGSWTLTPAELAGLTVSTTTSSQDVVLLVTATSTETANGDTADTSAELAVNVNYRPDLYMWIDNVDGTDVTIAGQVTDDSPGVHDVTFSGVASGSVSTDATGYFEVTLQASELGAIDGVAHDSEGLDSTVQTVWVTSDTPVVDIFIYDLDERTITIHGTVYDENPESTSVTLSGIVSGTVTPNADGTFVFTAEASSPGIVSAVATDVWGQQSDVATTELTNEAPVIEDFSGSEQSGNFWVFTGVVLDEDPEGLIVTFGGLLEGYTATVNLDGTFSLVVELDPEASGLVTAITTDWWGMGSEEETWLVS